MPIFVGAGTSSFMKGSDGVGFTRINTTQRNALTAVEGQVIFNTTSGVLEYYDGSAWAKVSAVLAVLSSVSGNIFAGAATNLTLSGTGFLASNLVVNFNQSADNINVMLQSHHLQIQQQQLQFHHQFIITLLLEMLLQ